MPRSVTKVTKNGIEFTSNVDRVNYTMKELCRAALRDVGKLVCKRFRQSYYARFKRRRGRIGKYTQYWVRNTRICRLVSSPMRSMEDSRNLEAVKRQGWGFFPPRYRIICRTLSGLRANTSRLWRMRQGRYPWSVKKSIKVVVRTERGT